MAHWHWMGMIETGERLTTNLPPGPPPRVDLSHGNNSTIGGWKAPTVREVIASLARHPVDNLLVRWNWKSALLSSLLRGTIFFFTNLISGWHAAVGALLAEFALRAATSGFYGAITESLSAAQPSWAATVAALIALPIMAHTIEILVHWLRGTPQLGLSIAASVIFTAFSTAFNLFVMRRGVLITNGESKSLVHDLSRIPMLFLEFVWSGPRKLKEILVHTFSAR